MSASRPGHVCAFHFEGDDGSSIVMIKWLRKSWQIMLPISGNIEVVTETVEGFDLFM